MSTRLIGHSRAPLALAAIRRDMDAKATLWTVEVNPAVAAVARRHLGHDPRLRFFVEDGEQFLARERRRRFDLIFADSWPGKFSSLALTLELLAVGGYYVIDDLLPQSNWPSDHQPNVDQLVAILDARPDLVLTKLDWSTGLIVATHIGR